mmetsp:Transcript_22787/g.41901  ORF Transcript_22787/g.41901 Transcript_22787/m.41901 type:complete len:252 (-) Transcript_22787:41-796(-)
MSQRASWLRTVSRNGGALKDAPEEVRSDREVVLAAVQQTWRALEYAKEPCSGDSKIVMEALRQDWRALQWAMDACKSDREVVLAAVQQKGRALQFAKETCRSNRQIVLTAVQKDWEALGWAAEPCNSDQEIVLKAVKQDPRALQYASDGLVKDPLFAAEEKEHLCIIKVRLMSGRSCYLALQPPSMAHTFPLQVVEWSCCRLGITCTGSEELVYGSEPVPARTPLPDWPGNPRCASETEYQLIVTKHRRVT